MSAQSLPAAQRSDGTLISLHDLVKRTVLLPIEEKSGGHWTYRVVDVRDGVNGKVVSARPIGGTYNENVSHMSPDGWELITKFDRQHHDVKWTEVLHERYGDIPIRVCFTYEEIVAAKADIKKAFPDATEVSQVYNDQLTGYVYFRSDCQNMSAYSHDVKDVVAVINYGVL